MFAVTGGAGFCGPGDGWDLSRARYDGVSFGSSAEDTIPTALFFKPDGRKMFVLGNIADGVFQYSLSSPWDISTASYDEVSFGSSAEDINPHGLYFRDDGLKMFILGGANDRTYQYTLSTAWASSTASYDEVSFGSSAEETGPQGLFFKPDGMKAYVIGVIGISVFQYALSTAWASSTASYDSVSFNSSAEDATPEDIVFKPDGTRMYIVGAVNDRVSQYLLSTPWDLDTAKYDGVSLSVQAQDITPRGLFFKQDGTKMFVAGGTNGRIYQYSL